MRTRLSAISGLFVAGVIAMILTGCSTLYDRLGGPFLPAGEAYQDSGLSLNARGLINVAFTEFEGKTLQDFHVHFFGNGMPEPYTYCAGLNELDPRLRPKTNFKRFIAHQLLWQRPFIRGIYLDTIDVADIEKMDDQYMDRLVTLVANYGPPGQALSPANSPYRADFYLMAMDGVYDSDGVLDDQSFNFVSNEYIVKLVDCLNAKLDQSGGFIRNRFRAVGSINPMRAKSDGTGVVMRDIDDLRSEILFLKNNKVRWIKWRPPSMAFDPAEVSTDFYNDLKLNGIGILSHTGSSNGVRLGEDLDRLGSPKRLRNAAKLGVDVVMLHIGRTGNNSMNPGNCRDCEGKPYSEEFFAVLDEAVEKDWKIRGELSVVPYDDTHELLAQIGRYPGTRFVNGSDYPAVTPYLFVKSTLKKLRRAGWLEPADADSLEQIYRYNPLLFDFVLKRTLAKKSIAIPKAVFTAGS